MPWITVIDEKQAEGKLKEIYENISKKRGKISNIMKIHSLRPKIMQKHMDLYLSILFGKSNLKRVDRELIAVVVFSINDCDYCISHHAEALNYYWKDKSRIKKLIKDYNKIKLSDREKKMLDYVTKLTKKPESMMEEDVNILKYVGFGEEEILDINLITSYFNLANRIAQGLGVEFSEEEIKGYKY